MGDVARDAEIIGDYAKSAATRFPAARKRGKSVGGGAFFACADLARWILYIMFRRPAPSPI